MNTDGMTIWLLRGTESAHRELALPERFRPPVTWFAAVFQGLGGKLGFSFAPPDVAQGVLRAVIPAISISVPDNRWTSYIDDTVVYPWRGFGDRVWVCASPSALRQFDDWLAARQAAIAKNRLLARYNREPSPVPPSPAEKLLNNPLDITWPVYLSRDAGTEAAQALWYGFSSSKGDYTVCVGKGADWAADQLTEVVPSTVAVRLIDTPDELPSW